MADARTVDTRNAGFILTDERLEPIAAKVLAGERLSKEDGLALYASPDIVGIGQLADHVRRAKNDDVVYFNVNRHINPTNICSNKCKFCAFWRDEADEDAYAMTLEEMVRAAEDAAPSGITELHIVGGLHPDWPYEFYLDMMRKLKAALPDVLIQAFTAVEIDYFAKISEQNSKDVLAQLKEAGLDSLPGGGAEIFSERLRSIAWEKKTSAADWLRIHGEAHELGMHTNCTMLYGHIETIEERVEHMIALREQQDRSGGFLAFIPLAFHPANTELSDLPGTTGYDDLKTLAIARLMLDNIPHIKAFWIMVGLKIAQISTAFGVDDLDGTVVEERITHAAGATTPEALSKEELIALIEETGHRAVERDTLYQVVGDAGSGAV
jgi:aminodeoxyfutalosine synthase